MTVPTPEIVFDASSQSVLYHEPRRRVLVRCDVDDGWWLRPGTIQWWEGDRGSRPVTDLERAQVVDRVLAEGRRRGYWIGVAGEPRPSRPAQPPDDNPELAAFDAWATEGDPASDDELLGWIGEALGFLEPLEHDWDVAASIARQLRWCQATVRGEPVEPAPGSLSMALLATREFDQYGSEPDRARLIERIAAGMRARGVA